RNIAIRIDKDEKIEFSDDGDGVLLDNFPALFTLGDHIQLKETRLGRFGVGITAQQIHNANRMTVRSPSADGCFYACADWKIVERRGWEIPDPVRKPNVVGAET